MKHLTVFSFTANYGSVNSRNLIKKVIKIYNSYYKI